jgi:hypothetical protein
MMRDMELIRKILLQIQSREDIAPSPVEIEGVDEIVLARHMELLRDAGLIEATSTTISSKGYKYARIFVKDLTWEGHDFISALQNEGVWNQIKQSLSPSELATLPLTIMREVGLGLLGAYVKQKLGLS